MLQVAQSCQASQWEPVSLLYSTHDSLQKKKLENKTAAVLQGKLRILESRDFPGGPVVKSSPSSAGDARLIPGWKAKNPHALWLKKKKKKNKIQNIKQKQHCNKLNKDFN